MAYFSNSPDPALFEQDLAYDLRQIYAKLVGQHLEDIAEARKADNYNIYFKALEDLHVIIHHRFKSKEVDEEEYQALVNKAAVFANKFSTTWLGQAKDQNEAAEIERALRAIEMFLYDKMQAANMFGSNKRIEGL